MGDIKSPVLLYIKGGLMLLVGMTASILLMLQHPDLMTVVLLAVAIWGFCRAYYFAFYVISHYLEPGRKYAGLIDFVKYSVRRRWRS
jgi:hypothetical protein